MLQPGDLFAGYRIERQLGRGGMGSVHLAQHPRLPRRIALKLLNRELFSDSEIRARFEREADLAAGLHHSNIVTVYDRGVEGDQPWIAMQYVEGVDASSLDPARLPPQRAVRIITEVAAALDYAHGKGVLHRDVKPANMLLERSATEATEQVLLTDFGIARLYDEQVKLTRTGTVTATLAYASPEQLSGIDLDHRTDQYSLACSLFWLLTGTGPYTGPNPGAVITGHLQQTPPSASAARPGLPPAVDAVLAKGLAKRPQDRFGSCAEFAAAAREAVEQPATQTIPMAQHPVSPPTPRRGPGVRLTGAIVGVILLVAAGLIATRLMSQDSSADATGGTSTPTSVRNTDDSDAISRVFPKLVLPGEDSSKRNGYNGAKCERQNGGFGAGPGDKVYIAGWASAWRCSGATVKDPSYIVFAFAAPDRVRAERLDLPLGIDRNETNHGLACTNHRFASTGGGTTIDDYDHIVTSFENDATRMNFLVHAYNFRYGTGMSPSDFENWWQDLPLA